VTPVLDILFVSIYFFIFCRRIHKSLQYHFRTTNPPNRFRHPSITNSHFFFTITLLTQKTLKPGVCHADPKGLRRKSSNTSMSSIKVPTRSAQSCPSSPRISSSLRSRADQLQQQQQQHQLQQQTTSSSTTHNYHNDGLQRSGSIMSVGSYRPRSSPSGLYSYTGKGCDSAPGSVRGSRADLVATTSKETGSVIYLGCKSKGSSSTPPVSPKRSLRG
jgi:hypothetical protein